MIVGLVWIAKDVFNDLARLHRVFTWTTARIVNFLAQIVNLCQMHFTQVLLLVCNDQQVI